MIDQVKIFHVQMVYDAFCSYFLFSCQVDYQGNLVVYFTMFMCWGEHIKIIQTFNLLVPFQSYILIALSVRDMTIMLPVLHFLYITAPG